MACFVRYDVEEEFRAAMKEAGFITKAQVIWDKVIHGMGDLKGDFAPCHENIIFATKGRFVFPGKRPKSVVRVQRVNAEALQHPNEKPVELMSYFVEHLCPPGGAVLDPFMGVGGTGVAAKQLGRSFVGIEQDETYFAIASKRLSP
jgi:site-specific DNA-methyltransferase (adenine-specific)